MKSLGESIARVLILTAITLFLLSPGHCQSAISVYGIGNYNPTTQLILTSQPAIPWTYSTNKSSMGGAVEYDYKAFGILAEANPSGGNLFGTGNRVFYRWPQMRYEVLGLVTRKAAAGRFSIFTQAGAGAVVTNGYGNSGWSHDLALAWGSGVSYPLTPKLSFVTSLLFLDARTGCYNDPTCKPSWGVVEDAHVGVRLSFQR